MISKKVLVPLVILLCACTRTPDAPLPTINAAQLDDSEGSLTQEFNDQAAKLWGEKDYEGLEKLGATDRAMASPFGSGRLPITFFYEGITSSPGSESADTYSQTENALQAWIKARPESVSAKIALAMVLTNDAWFARGSGYANTVSEDGWTIFGKKLNQASDALESVKGKRQDYPEWYTAHNCVGMGLSENKDTYLATALEGTSRYPAAVEIYAGVEAFLLPRWFGSNQELLDYVTESANKVGGDEGDVLYARLAKSIWIYAYDFNVFSEVGLSWPRVEHGMQLLCDRYPHSTIVANYFCLFAYQAKDHAAAHTLFDQLGDRYDSVSWGTRENFDAARTWAQ